MTVGLYQIRQLPDHVVVEEVGVIFDQDEPVFTHLGTFANAQDALREYSRISWRSMQGLAPLSGDILYVGILQEANQSDPDVSSSHYSS